MIVDEVNNLNERIEQAHLTGEAEVRVDILDQLSVLTGVPKKKYSHIYKPKVGLISLSGRQVIRTTG